MHHNIQVLRTAVFHLTSESEEIHTKPLWWKILLLENCQQLLFTWEFALSFLSFAWAHLSYLAVLPVTQRAMLSRPSDLVNAKEMKQEADINQNSFMTGKNHFWMV